MRRRHAPMLQLGGLACLWGTSFTLIKLALDGLSPALLVLSRLVLGGLVLVAFAAVTRIRLPSESVVWMHLVAAGAAGNVVPFLLLSYGEQSASASAAGVLIAATPLLTLALAAVALPDERVTRRKIVGFVIGFVGVVVLLGPWGTAMGSPAGLIACFGAAASYAVGFVYVRRFLSHRRLPATGMAAAQLLVASGIQSGVAAYLPWRDPRLSSAVVLATLLLGLLSTGVAYVLYFRLIDEIGATSASAVNYLVPFVGVVVAVGVLGESVTWNLLAGAVLIVLGVAHAENRLARWRRDSPSRYPELESREP